MNVAKFEKSFIKYLTKDIKDIDIGKEILEKGDPIVYVDKKERVIREYPNGKKFLVEFNKETNKTFDAEEVYD